MATPRLRGMRGMPAPVRFFERVDKGGENGCWIWLGGKDRGWGRFAPGGEGVTRMAHRWSYEYHVGPIPDGLVVDHLCRNRSCVNPDHLQPVSNAANAHRGNPNSWKTHCKYGHEFTPENTYLRGTRERVCITCRRRRFRDYYARKVA